MKIWLLYKLLTYIFILNCIFIRMFNHKKESYIYLICYRYIGVCSGLKVASGLLFFLDWMLISWKHKKDIEQPPTLTVGEIVSSIISLDRLSTLGWGELPVDGNKDSPEDIQPLEMEEESYSHVPRPVKRLHKRDSSASDILSPR